MPGPPATSSRRRAQARCHEVSTRSSSLGSSLPRPQRALSTTSSDVRRSHTPRSSWCARTSSVRGVRLGSTTASLEREAPETSLGRISVMQSALPFRLLDDFLIRPPSKRAPGGTMEVRRVLGAIVLVAAVCVVQALAGAGGRRRTTATRSATPEAAISATTKSASSSTTTSTGRCTTRTGTSSRSARTSPATRPFARDTRLTRSHT